MSLVKENAIDHTFNGLIQGSIIKNDIRCLTTEFECCLFVCTSDGFLDDFSNIS